jgi:hypothetical protein
MIEWPTLFYHFIWILGLAMLLTTLSLANWQTERQGKSFGQGLNKPSYRLASSAAFMLLALGMALSIEPLMYKASWLALLILALWAGIVAWRDRSGKIN